MSPSGTWPGLYPAETDLAADLGSNVSNLDSPQNLSTAEVNYQTDMDYGGYGISPQRPDLDLAGQQAVAALAAACGVG